MASQRTIAVALVALLVGALVPVPIESVGAVFPNSQTPASDTASTDDGQSFLLWTNDTTISNKVETADLSHAGNNGTLHIAYTNGNAIEHVRITTRGRITQRSTVATPEGTVKDVQIARTSDGYVHIIYTVEKGIDSRSQIKRLTLTANNSTITQTLRDDGGNLSVNYSIGNVAADGFGRVHLPVIRKEIKTDNSEQQPKYTLDLVTVHSNSTGTQSHRVYAPSQPDFDASSFSVDLGYRSGVLYVALSEEATFREPNGPASHDDRAFVRLDKYRITLQDISHQSTSIVARANTDGELYTPGAELHSVSVHPAGYAIVSYGFDERGDPLQPTTIVHDGTQQLSVLVQDKAPRSMLWDVDDRLFAKTGSTYRVYATNGTQLQHSGQVSGITAWALNRAGYPSMLRLEGGTLSYRALTLNVLLDTGDVYERYDGPDTVLRQEIADLRAQVNETSGCNIAGEDGIVDISDLGKAASLYARGEPCK